MRIQYKHQKFQADAAKAVVDVFAGQPYLTPTYMMDRGSGNYQTTITENQDYIGWGNQRIIPELNNQIILDHIKKIQRNNLIEPSSQLEGLNTGYNLTIEMETGVGKTYTYIKTMYELNKAYGWSKFIIIVPSIAIREGVYKSFQMTEAHFKEEYKKSIHYFIYNSGNLEEINHFASDSSINAMIINSQAFNKDVSSVGKKSNKGKDMTPIIFKRLETFRNRRPIDVIAKTNPILIIDEPQSVEGKQTKENLKRFHPMITLRYSATHRTDSIYNMIYRLDAMEAYNKKLVKKIAVKGISEIGTKATDSYVYLESINLSKANPTATISYEIKQKNGSIKKKSKIFKEGDNLYYYSNELEEYKEGFVIDCIDGRDDSVHFQNGIKIFAGDVVGALDEDELRRIQIRETILSHLQRERQLFYKGIKVLSLFFIDEVANYREYDAANQPMNGKYATMFEEEYEDVISNWQQKIGEDEYISYLKSIPAKKTHEGYFSVDKKGNMINSKVGRKETTSDDVSAYELIMKNKELLLDRDPKKSPVRFIFSHSALREGWDNPNVFQICTLKQSSSDVRKRQEVGRGLRLCVNQDGERMDINALGADVHNVNVLTVIASESYDSFAKGLQTEIAEVISDRPKAVTEELFVDQILKDGEGNELLITKDIATEIRFQLRAMGYIDKLGTLLDKYYEDKSAGAVQLAEEVRDYYDDMIKIIDSVYNPNALKPDNARGNNVELQVDEEKLHSKEFQELWKRINSKTVYTVDFDPEELIRNSIAALNSKLRVSKAYFSVETGTMDSIKSKDSLSKGTAFKKESAETYKVSVSANANVRYDLVGKIVEETSLTRKDIVAILKGVEEIVFNQFGDNPEEFISKTSQIINDQKAAVIIEHITYNVMDEKYSEDIFNDATIRGKLDVNAIKTNKHLFSHMVYDSIVEKDFAQELDVSNDVAVYVKLPNSFYISTPVGKYNPDWAIAFYEGNVKHIYFVAETKGSLDTLQFQSHISGVEEAKIKCAEKHFKAISNDNVVYSVVPDYKTLMQKVMK